ncbi:hypothetical protein B0H10DRAFT_217860 [Mycena sp. CBHHK59/15]|nr:hypothetical protein B0H10DRAFT_217860 [Mycena sp. CBHHK59/15]
MSVQGSTSKISTSSLTFKRASSSNDWIGGLLVTARTARDAGDFVPFPYVKTFFGTVVVLLEVIQTVRKNQDDLKELCDSVAEITVILQEEISLHGDTSAVRFKSMCIDFNKYLRSVLEALQNMNDGRRGFGRHIRQYIKSTSITADIQMFQARLNNLRTNFTLATAVDTNLNLARVHGEIISKVQQTVGNSTLEIRQEFTTLRSELRAGSTAPVLQKFRTIPAGDLNLLHEVSQDDGHAALIWRDPNMKNRRGVNVIRTIYTAHIPGEASTMTVIQYEGDDAQRVWREDLDRYADLRHPNILQLYGVAPQLPATVFYDGSLSLFFILFFFSDTP